MLHLLHLQVMELSKFAVTTKIHYRDIILALTVRHTRGKQSSYIQDETKTSFVLAYNICPESTASLIFHLFVTHMWMSN